MADIAKIVLMRSHPGRSDHLAEALRKLVTSTRDESGNAACILHRSEEDEDLFMVYECWKGEAAFASHMDEPHTAEFLSRLDELLAVPPEIQPFTPL